MLAEIITAAIELVVGHVSGLSIAVSLLVGAHYLGYLKHLAGVARHLRLVAVLFAALVLSGALDVGDVLGVVSTLVGLVGGLLL